MRFSFGGAGIFFGFPLFEVGGGRGRVEGPRGCVLMTVIGLAIGSLAWHRHDRSLLLVVSALIAGMASPSHVVLEDVACFMVYAAFGSTGPCTRVHVCFVVLLRQGQFA